MLFLGASVLPSFIVPFRRTFALCNLRMELNELNVIGAFTVMSQFLQMDFYQQIMHP